MATLAAWAVEHRRVVLVAWMVVIGLSCIGASRLQTVLKGASDGVPGSRSVETIRRAVGSGIPAGTFFPFLVVLTSEQIDVQDARFQAAALAVEERLRAVTGGGVVRSYWNTGRVDLLGTHRRSALMLFRSNAQDLNQAEVLTLEVREAVRQAGLSNGIRALVTGTAPMYFDLNRQSSADLLHAERVGLPVTLLILLVTFGAPLAAVLPVLLGLSVVAISAAGLFLLSTATTVSVFSQNVVAMIGLGVGVDYALFIVTSFREALAQGCSARESAVRSVSETGRTILVSGLAVAIGFCALLLVNVPFLRSMATGGVLVVLTAVVASLTLLPALLSWAGAMVNWPRHQLRPVREGTGVWVRWTDIVMRRPWAALAAGLLVLAALAMPVARIQSGNIGVAHLGHDLEARAGYDVLVEEFEQGAIGPTLLLLEVPAPRTVWDPDVPRGVTALSERLSEDPRIARVNGFPDFLSVASSLKILLRSSLDFPEHLRPLVRDVVSADERMALIVILPASLPESPDSMALIDELRRDTWPELAGLGASVDISGATALVRDFDAEVFGRMRTVVPVVLITTFLVLLVSFRSLVIPLKAVLLNLLSVLASYGFLVYVFQDGRGAAWINLTPPGGLNSLIVLVLFTVLFGLSMDYEVFLLSRIQEAYLVTGDNSQAVALGVQRTAGPISSAALVMISIFMGFGFTRLVVTRELGFGLAFAVALDATLVRLVLVPAVMVLLGRFNWWFPARRVKRAVILAP